MLNVSYTISPILRESLQKIESLRRDILLTPLAPKTEIRMRWEGMVNKVYWSLALSNNPLSRKEMLQLLTPIQSGHKKKLTLEENEVIKYKKALDYISQDWLASPKNVTTKTVILLHEMGCFGRFQGPETSLRQLLDYLQASSEHPVVQAAIAQIHLSNQSLFSLGNGRLSRLLGLLFLYKAGFDVKGFYALEEYFRHDLTGFNYHLENALKLAHITAWLEYFAENFVAQLEKVYQNISSQIVRLDLPISFWELNDRQKAILTLLEQPDATITNKKVQKNFKVSQITASRDLSKLTTLGMLFARGKGRSVYYTRV